MPRWEWRPTPDAAGGSRWRRGSSCGLSAEARAGPGAQKRGRRAGITGAPRERADCAAQRWRRQQLFVQQLACGWQHEAAFEASAGAKPARARTRAASTKARILAFMATVLRFRVGVIESGRAA